MSYQHGIYIKEASDSIQTPKQTTSGLQVIIGTAPVNLAANPEDAVNKPILVNDLNEAKAAVGYCDDFEKYTLCQSIDASFNKFKIAPIVLINVLDPSVHNADVADTVNIVNGKAQVNTFGVLLDENFVVKDSTGATTYVKDTDYSVVFDDNGYPVITVLNSSSISKSATTLKVSYKKLDPTKVKNEDIIGGYTEETNTYKGIECITQVYPKFNIVPGLLLAPGWSQYPDVEKALNAKNTAINGCFNCEVLSDIDCSQAKTFNAAVALKNTNGYKGNREFVLWPKIKIDDKIYWYSAILAASICLLDSQSNDVPYKSPSNKKIPISSTVLADGSEVFLDQPQANVLNGAGIITAINMSGWCTWGNNLGAYPDITDLKDRFASIRRIFDWWGNNFVIDFYDKVDDPTNYRLIESVVDDENLKSNGFQAAGQIAGAKILFSQSDNPLSDILNGKIQFTQTIGAFPPAENIVNTLSFDVNSVQNSLGGSSSD